MNNYICLKGKVFTDARHGFTKRGNAYTSFLFEVSEQKKTTIIKCVCWSEFKALKGDEFTLEGSLDIRNYKDKNNNWAKDVSVVFDKVDGKQLEKFSQATATMAKEALKGPKSFVEASAMWEAPEPDVPF